MIQFIPVTFVLLLVVITLVAKFYVRVCGRLSGLCCCRVVGAVFILPLRFCCYRSACTVQSIQRWCRGTANSLCTRSLPPTVAFTSAGTGTYLHGWARLLTRTPRHTLGHTCTHPHAHSLLSPCRP
jgi:hypothetical protein